jgi:hypothetical protein
MELFPSMSYADVLAMDFKEFRMLHQIRIKRKLEEQEQMEKERAKLEKESKNNLKRSGRRRK